MSLRRAPLAVLVALAACGDGGGGAKSDLRVNHLQALGTHNSYHQLTQPALDPALDYQHAPLPDQLDAGVRHFELDAHRDAETGAIAVYHIKHIDDASSCATLGECLDAIRGWSDAHPHHHLLVVIIEPKDDLARVAVSVGKDPAVTGELLWDGHIADLDSVIRASWPDRLLTPAAVRGRSASLRAALDAHGWPLIDDTRQELAVVLNDTAALRDEYRADVAAGADPAQFVFGEPSDDDAGFYKADDPTSDPEGLAAALQAGLIARTRADADTDVDPAVTQAALASGAQLVSTDYPVARTDGAHPGYRIPWPGTPEHPSRCNPVTAPPDCRDDLIE